MTIKEVSTELSAFGWGTDSFCGPLSWFSMLIHMVVWHLEFRKSLIVGTRAVSYHRNTWWHKHMYMPYQKRAVFM